MRMMKVAAVLFLAATIPAVPASAQIEIRQGEPLQLPPPGRQMKTGTGRIKGRLVAAETGAPVRRGQVRLTGPDIMPKSVVTDNEGAFEFRDLPAGRYTINATVSQAGRNVNARTSFTIR